MIGINQVGIQKCQGGTSRGGLVNHSNSGSWGDRGRGNELQSTLEKGLTWIGDKVMNFGDYIDQGAAYLTSALPGGMTAQESLQEERNKQLARNNGERGYVNNQDEYKLFPYTGMPNTLPNVSSLSKILNSGRLSQELVQKFSPMAGRIRAGQVMSSPTIQNSQKIREQTYNRFKNLYKQGHLPEDKFNIRTSGSLKQFKEVAPNKTNNKLATKENIGGYYDRKTHTIRVRTKGSPQNIENTGFHEAIHSQGLGEAPSYLWKTKYLPFPKSTNPYFMDPTEIATHSIQYGQKIGIGLGQPFPGVEKMKQLLDSQESISGIPLILYRNSKSQKDYRLLWELLNGTF